MNHHPNYCRQMLKAFQPFADSRNEGYAPYWNAMELAQFSRKFMLPDSGRLIEDKQLKALDENEVLRLPFPIIALEYKSDPAKNPLPGEVAVSRRICFVREQGTFIVLTPVAWFVAKQQWVPLPEIAINNVGYLDRTKITNGYVAVLVARSDPRLPDSDYYDEIGAVLCFLNALQCSNVKIDRSYTKQGKVKSAYPFDTYHVLTIETNNLATGVSYSGSHRSPREHLRRGHIRRLPDRKIWVNAAVIGAGKGAGKITKDYVVQ